MPTPFSLVMSATARRSSADQLPKHCLQMVDILLGATSHRINGHHLREGSSATKNGFAPYILDRAGIADATKDTSKTGSFTIWHRRLR